MQLKGNIYKNRKIVLASIVYISMLVYIVSALFFWYVSLQHQNTELLYANIKNVSPQNPDYNNIIANAYDYHKRKKFQYYGEGITFFIFIAIGAMYVYGTIRKQLRFAQQQQNFMMAITHELKTPISVAKLNLETIQKRQPEISIQNKLINNTLKETERLNDLCNNILLAARMDDLNFNSSKSNLNLSEITENGVDVYTKRLPDRQFNTNIDDNVQLNGDAILLELLLNNLIENAGKYSPKGTDINISLLKKEKHIELSVADLGPGIDNVDKKLVFQKFYRLGNENTRTAKGTGLGLYLCKKIAQMHKAQLIITDNVPNGCIFTLVLPIK